MKAKIKKKIVYLPKSITLLRVIHIGEEAMEPFYPKPPLEADFSKTILTSKQIRSSTANFVSAEQDRDKRMDR